MADGFTTVFAPLSALYAEIAEMHEVRKRVQLARGKDTNMRYAVLRIRGRMQMEGLANFLSSLGVEYDGRNL